DERQRVEAAAWPAAFGDRAQPRPDRDEVPEAAQHVAALGDPRHRLDAKRMDGEEERGEGGAELHRQGRGALAERRREKPPADQEYEDGRPCVQERVAQEVAARPHPADHVVEAEAEPRQRDVVAHEGCREHPAELRAAEAAESLVAEEVLLVVPVEELSVEGREKCARGDDEDEGSQARCEPARAARRGRARHGGRGKGGRSYLRPSRRAISFGSKQFSRASSTLIHPLSTRPLSEFSMVSMPAEEPVWRSDWIWHVLFSRIRLRIAGVITSISRASAIPGPSRRGMSCCVTTASSTLASCTRAWCCWCGGKTSTMRSMPWAGVFVCRVAKTRWPVSAAVSA